jgi:GxxExxY protein
LKNYEHDPLTHAVIGAAIKVHRELGPGYIESMYEEALCIELKHRNISFQRQFPVAVTYRLQAIGEGRLDLLVENRLIVELKAVESLDPIHTAQILSYLKMTKLSVGLLINFIVAILTKGIRRFAL